MEVKTEREKDSHICLTMTLDSSQNGVFLCVCVTVKHDCSVFGAVAHLYSHRTQITASTDSLHVRELKASDCWGGGVFDELSKESRKMLYCKIM